MRVRPQGSTASVAALLAVLVGWLCTSSTYSMGVNWDTAAYAADIGGASPWASLPWNSHYGVGHIYWLVMHLMAWLGLPALDGIRVANTLALAWSAAALTFCARALGLRPAMRLVVAGVYLTAWGTLILVATWEDNVLVQPAALSALAVCLARINAWRGRDSAWAGALVGLSSLMSWQGAAYLLPVGCAALLAGRERTWTVRLRDALFVPMAFAGTRALWTIAFWMSASKLSLTTLLVTAFERPKPNFLPEAWKDWMAMLSKPRDILTHAGIGLTHELGPSFQNLPGVWARLHLLGGLLIGISLLLWLLLALLLRRRVNVRVRFLSVAFLCLTAATVIYLDVPADKYKRYDYLPIFASLAIPVACLGLERWFASKGVWRGGIRRLCLAVVCVLVLAQGVAAYRWNRQWYLALRDDPSDYRGRAGQTWLAFLRSVRRQDPTACFYVFAFSEMANGQYQLEIPAALSAELARARVIGAPQDAHFWGHPLPLADAAFVKANLRGCEWVSPQAQALIMAAR
jgi:hypothetical protein